MNTLTRVDCMAAEAELNGYENENSELAYPKRCRSASILISFGDGDGPATVVLRGSVKEWVVFSSSSQLS